MPAIDIAERFRDAIPINRCSDFIPGNPHCATVWRWATRGVRGIRLATVIIGGRRMVTPQALEDFLQRLNADQPIDESETNDDVARRAKAAKQGLAAFGI